MGEGGNEREKVVEVLRVNAGLLKGKRIDGRWRIGGEVRDQAGRSEARYISESETGEWGKGWQRPARRHDGHVNPCNGMRHGEW